MLLSLDVDFISPGAACVKPIRPKADNSDSKRRVLRIEGGNDQLVEQEKVTAAISLADCLACSGCITSAEAVLVSQQSISQFRQEIANPSMQLKVVSVAPSARAALAASAKLDALGVLRRIDALFKSLGCHHVFDTSVANNIWLLEMSAEFIQRFRKAHVTQGQEPTAACLPVLSSSCPGWVCYAEKTQGESVVDCLSRIKSPQQIAGTLIKYWYAARLGVSPDGVHHAAIMPCYDKKLEASREDFIHDQSGTREVDVVLAVTEVEELARDECGSLSACPLTELNDVHSLSSGYPVPMLQALAGASGGAAEYVFREAARELHGVTLPPGPLTWERGRNADVAELNLRVNNQVVLRFVRAYGFRNIQNVVRRLKSGRCDYHFVELMACPSGCANGGGLPKPPPLEGAHRVEQIESMVREGTFISPRDHPLLAELYSAGGFLSGGPGGGESCRWLRTDFRPLREDPSGTSLSTPW